MRWRLKRRKPHSETGKTVKKNRCSTRRSLRVVTIFSLRIDICKTTQLSIERPENQEADDRLKERNP